MEEDKNLKCPPGFLHGEGHYDPAGPGSVEKDGKPECAGCGCLWSAHIRECRGCGRHEVALERHLYKGPLYKDALNGDPYCIMCSSAFYKMGRLPDGVVRADNPDDRNVGKITENDDGESYMTFKIHPDAHKTAPGPGGIAAYANEVTVKRASIKSVREDRKDPEAFLLITDVGRLHVTGVPKDKLLDWLEQGQETGDTGKPKEGG